MGTEYLLEMKDICKSFPGVKALDHVHLNVRPGQVHALMGENGAGKSTLMKCLFGIYHKDAGEITLNGKEINFKSPHDALNHGVSMIHQELEQVQMRNVADNIWLGRYPTRFGQIDDGKMLKDTEALMKDFGIDIDPRTKISDLSVSMRQMVEIVKAASWNAKVIVMDEPTSSLTEKETEKLFEIIARLKKSGCGIIFISHKIDEVLSISDSVTVMRDGQYVCTEPVENLNADKLVHYMVNRDLADRFPKNDARIGDVILKVEHLTTYYEPKVQDVSFEVHAGEILGIGGLVGARRTELMEALFGLRRIDTGTITFRDQRFVPKNSVNAMKHGLALVSEERRATGIIPMLSVEDNANISSLSRSTNRFGFISPAKMRENAQWVIDSMAVKTPSPQTPISNLSGGNQQKVIIGRCLLTEPEILLMDEPTRGIDVGAKYEIYQLMINIAKEGKAVIFISSEMPELLGVANRILVMSNGRVAGIEPASQLDQEKIFKLSAKYL